LPTALPNNGGITVTHDEYDKLTKKAKKGELS